MNSRRLQRFVILLSAIGVLVVGGGVLSLQRRQRQYALDRRLIAALEKNDSVQALALVNAGADPNTPHEPPPTPSLQYLWNHLPHRPSASKIVGPSAFPAACGAYSYRRDLDAGLTFSDSPQLVQAMLQHGANINARDVNGETPLLWAAGQDNSDTVGVLLAHATMPARHL